MVSLLKLQDWNSCASFRWSPDFHMSCNHWGTCRRPFFFGSHSLRNRAFKAALSFVGRNMSEHPMWNSINVLRPNKVSQIKYVRVYSDWLLLRIQNFYHWEKMKVIGCNWYIYQKQHAHDCWTIKYQIWPFWLIRWNHQVRHHPPGNHQLKWELLLGSPQQWASFGHLQWVGHLPQGASLPYCHQSGHLQAAHALWLLPCDGEDWRNLGLETSTSIVSN